MREHSESATRRHWFTVGVAISLSTATFATPIGKSMDQPWRKDGKAIDYRRGKDTYYKVGRQPWSGAWWATSVGSVAIRWHTAMVWTGDTRRWPSLEESHTLTYEPYTADQLARMSEKELLENLSPIEKVDVVAGHTKTYPNLAQVRGLIRYVTIPHWEDQNGERVWVDLGDEMDYHGQCHGFSQASIWLSEPDLTNIPANLTLSDGSTRVINVPFGSGDLKAIATYYYGLEVAGRRVEEVVNGKKTKVWKPSPYQSAGIGTNGGDPMNPAALHLLLLNMVKDADQSFVVDLSPSAQVWNYAVVGYDITTTGYGTPSADASPEADKVAYVETRVDYQRTTNPDDRAFGPFPNAVFTGQQFKQKFYRYRLELTSDDRIVGGSWLPSSDLADFAWTLSGKIPFEGDYAFLKQVWPD